MGPPVDPVETDEKPPAETGIVVIGGGIIGTSTALALAQKGIAVTLCEKGHIAGEQSSRNWGWVRKNGRDSREVPLIVESLRLWSGLNQTVGAETGFRACGIVSVARTDADRARHEKWVEESRDYQLGSRIVEGEELEELLPGAARQKFRSALYNPTDGRAEPQKAAPAIAAAVRREGGTVVADCAVRGLDLTGGRVTGVFTEKGRIKCDGVVLAGGAWSRLFCGAFGITLPQLKVLSSAARTSPVDGLPETSASTGDFAYRRRLDGGYNIAGRGAHTVPLVPDTFRFFREFLPALRAEWGSLHLRLDDRFLTEARMPKSWDMDKPSPFEAVRTLDPTPDASRSERALAGMKALFPTAAGMQIVQHWAGLIDVTPDAVPVISTVAEIPGLVIATGFSGHGFGIGPGAGRLAAELVTGADPVVDPTPFRFSRFTDGTKIVVEAGF
jgi:glycine/D-amino acid oxidase-like deaminating enzyme